MIQLKKYLVGFKLKYSDKLTLEPDALDKSEEGFYVLFIPESAVDDLKKGDIGEW